MSRSLVMAVVLMGASITLADSSALMPVDQIPVPNQQPDAMQSPAPQSTAPQAIQPGKVAILPFDGIGDVTDKDWVGRSVQQDLVTDVASLSGFSSVAANAPAIPVDAKMAVQVAKADNATLVIFGSYTIINDQIRFVAEIFSVDTGQSVQGLKVSGTDENVFALEDQLGSELKNFLLPGSGGNSPQPEQAPQPSNQNAVFGGAGQNPGYANAQGDGGGGGINLSASLNNPYGPFGNSPYGYWNNPFGGGPYGGYGYGGYGPYGYGGGYPYYYPGPGNPNGGGGNPGRSNPNPGSPMPLTITQTTIPEPAAPPRNPSLGQPFNSAPGFAPQFAPQQDTPSLPAAPVTPDFPTQTQFNSAPSVQQQTDAPSAPSAPMSVSQQTTSSPR